MSDKHATAAQQQQMHMAASPVPPAQAAAGPVELQAPVYFPDILPIYILKTDAKAAERAAEMAAQTAPPAAPAVAVANVDDPTSPPHKATEDPPAGLYLGTLGRVVAAPAKP